MGKDLSLTGRTASALEWWMEERERYDRYDGMDSLWLTTKKGDDWLTEREMKKTVGKLSSLRCQS